MPGNGLEAVIDGKALYGGNLDFISSKAEIPEEAKANAVKMAELGKTPLFFAYDGAFIGIIAVADIIKEDSPKAISELKNMGITSLPVLFSTEDPVRTGERVPASISFVPSCAGLMMAGYAVREIIK